MPWGKKKIFLEDIQDRKSEHKYMVLYYELLEKIILEPLDENKKGNIDYVIYKKYIELGNYTQVSDWLRANGYVSTNGTKPERKFSPGIVKEILEHRLPDVNPVINFLAKSIYEVDEHFVRCNYWWEKWETQNITYKYEKCEEEIAKLRTSNNEEIRTIAKMLDLEIYKAMEQAYDEDKEIKDIGRDKLDNLFKEHLKPLLDKEEYLIYCIEP